MNVHLTETENVVEITMVLAKCFDDVSSRFCNCFCNFVIHSLVRVVASFFLPFKLLLLQRWDIMPIGRRLITLVGRTLFFSMTFLVASCFYEVLFSKIIIIITIRAIFKYRKMN